MRRPTETYVKALVALAIRGYMDGLGLGKAGEGLGREWGALG